MKVKKLKRKPGQKRVQAKGKLFRRLPQFPDLREPRGPSPFMAFLESLGGEVSIKEARIEFQTEWCDHPRNKFSLLATRATVVDQDFSYQRVCTECGLIKTLKGRPPGWLVRQ